MKRIVSVSLGPSSADYEFTTTFLGHEFHVRRVGADWDVARAEALLRAARRRGRRHRPRHGARPRHRRDPPLHRPPHVPTGSRRRQRAGDHGRRAAHAVRRVGHPARPERGAAVLHQRPRRCSSRASPTTAWRRSCRRYTHNLRFADPVTARRRPEGAAVAADAGGVRQHARSTFKRWAKSGALAEDGPPARRLEPLGHAQGDGVGALPGRALPGSRAVLRGRNSRRRSS